MNEVLDAMGGWVGGWVNGGERGTTCIGGWVGGWEEDVPPLGWGWVMGSSTAAPEPGGPNTSPKSFPLREKEREEVGRSRQRVRQSPSLKACGVR